MAISRFAEPFARRHPATIVVQDWLERLFDHQPQLRTQRLLLACSSRLPGRSTATTSCGCSSRSSRRRVGDPDASPSAPDECPVLRGPYRSRYRQRAIVHGCAQLAAGVDVCAQVAAVAGGVQSPSPGDRTSGPPGPGPSRYGARHRSPRRGRSLRQVTPVPVRRRLRQVTLRRVSRGLMPPRAIPPRTSRVNR